MRKIIFVNTHPIQYNAPFYRYLFNVNLNFEVWYLSQGQIFDKGFNKKIVWDSNLLAGYNYQFVGYNFGNGNVNSWFGLLNFGLFSLLLRTKEKYLLVLPAWMPFSFLIAALLGLLKGHKLIIRTETPLNQFLFSKTIFFPFKKAYALFWSKIGSYYLYIGAQNYQFWKYLGVNDKKLFKAGYTVDNEFFMSKRLNQSQRGKLRLSFNFTEKTFVIIFVGKLIQKKRPKLLIDAVKELNRRGHDIGLLLLGDGEMRAEILSLLENESKIHFIGFVNQSDLPTYYSISDALVLPSGVGETWGLVANEALNFDLKLIISDLVGSAYDLIYDNNGSTFQCDSLQDLINAIELNINIFNSIASTLATPSIFYKNHSFESNYLCLKKILIRDEENSNN
jgi:glycosyltransferase involved in cell wall biosynthesis